MRRRNISWTPELDALAVRLATQSGYTDVSKFLADLVKREASGNKPSGYEAQMAEFREELTKLKESVTKTKRK